jgi:hypothetical protein
MTDAMRALTASVQLTGRELEEVAQAVFAALSDPERSSDVLACAYVKLHQAGGNTLGHDMGDHE